MFPDKAAINPATGKAYAINPASGNWDDNYYENWKKTQPGYAASQLQQQNKQNTDALVANQKAETDARFAQSKEDIQGFTSRYGAAVPQIVNDTSSKYGLGTLLGNAQALNTRVQDLKTNASGVGAGGYANADQVDRAVQTNYLPQYNTAVSNFQTGMGLAQAEQTQLLKPLETEGSMLNDRLAREATGYSQAQQRELDGLIEQMRIAGSLTQEQMQQATQLAVAEKQFQQALAVANTNNKAQSDANTQIVEIGGRKLLINSATGQTIKDLGTSGTGTGVANIGSYLGANTTGMSALQYNAALGGGAWN